VLSDWSNSDRVDTSLTTDTLFWFLAIQSLLELPNANVYIGEPRNATFVIFSLTPRFTTIEVSTLTISPLMTDVEEDKQHDSYVSTMLHLGRTTTIDIMKLYMIWKTIAIFKFQKLLKEYMI
jgi:hypothetical protein